MKSDRKGVGSEKDQLRSNKARQSSGGRANEPSGVGTLDCREEAAGGGEAAADGLVVWGGTQWSLWVGQEEAWQAGEQYEADLQRALKEETGVTRSA